MATFFSKYKTPKETGSLRHIFLKFFVTLLKLRHFRSKFLILLPRGAWLIQYHDGIRLLHQGEGHKRRFLLAAVILLVIVGAELLAVVRATHQISLAASVTIVLA